MPGLYWFNGRQCDVWPGAGPKTLCNACGVKRVRQMRTGSDSGRRKSTKPAAISHQDFADVLVTADYNGPKDTLQRRPSRKVVPALSPSIVLTRRGALTESCLGISPQTIHHFLQSLQVIEALHYLTRLRWQVSTKIVVRAMEEAAQPDWDEDKDQSCRSSQETGSVSPADPRHTSISLPSLLTLLALLQGLKRKQRDCA